MMVQFVEPSDAMSSNEPFHRCRVRLWRLANNFCANMINQTMISTSATTPATQIVSGNKSATTARAMNVIATSEVVIGTILSIDGADVANLAQRTAGTSVLTLARQPR